MSPFEIRDEKGKVLKGSCYDYISKSATNLNIEHPTQFPTMWTQNWFKIPSACRKY